MSRQQQDATYGQPPADGGGTRRRCKVRRTRAGCCHPCDRAPCFQARLEAAAGHRPVRRHAELCTEHLGSTVQALAAWARAQGLVGKVTVLAIDQPAPGQAASPALPGDRVLCSFAFGTILLNP